MTIPVWLYWTLVVLYALGAVLNAANAKASPGARVWGVLISLALVVSLLAFGQAP